MNAFEILSRVIKPIKEADAMVIVADRHGGFRGNVSNDDRTALIQAKELAAIQAKEERDLKNHEAVTIKVKAARAAIAATKRSSKNKKTGPNN